MAVFGARKPKPGLQQRPKRFALFCNEGRLTPDSRRAPSARCRLLAMRLVSICRSRPAPVRSDPRACQVNGELAEAVETGDAGKVRTCLMMQQMTSHKVKWTRETERAALFANPDSEEVRACVCVCVRRRSSSRRRCC